MQLLLSDPPISVVVPAKALWNTNALFAYVFAVKLFGLKWEPRRLLAVLLATLGVIVVVYGGSTVDQAKPSIEEGAKASDAFTFIKPSAPLVGDLLTLVASIGYGLYQVLYKKYAALPTDPEVIADAVYEHIPRNESSAPQPGESFNVRDATRPPFGLVANFLTSCIGLLTLVLLWVPIPFLHYLRIEPFVLPPNAKTVSAIAGIALSGVVFNAGFMARFFYSIVHETVIYPHATGSAWRMGAHHHICRQLAHDCTCIHL